MGMTTKIYIKDGGPKRLLPYDLVSGKMYFFQNSTSPIICYIINVLILSSNNKTTIAAKLYLEDGTLLCQWYQLRLGSEANSVNTTSHTCNYYRTENNMTALVSDCINPKWCEYFQLTTFAGVSSREPRKATKTAGVLTDRAGDRKQKWCDCDRQFVRLQNLD